MANTQNDRATIDLVINGQQAQTTLKQVSLAVTTTRSALLRMKETDAGYNDKLKDLHALLAAQRQMTASINNTTTAWGRFKSNAASTAVGMIGGNLVGTAISAVASAIPAAIAQYRAFDAASKELSAVTGATGADLEYLNQTAARTGPAFGKSGAEMLEAYKLMASAKPELLDQKELLTQTTEAAITLAQAGKIDLAEATKVTAESLNQFGESADQANRFINVIAAGAKEGAAEIADMSMALKASGTVASAAGVSFEQTNAVLQSMSTIALKGEQAGTMLRNVLLALGTGSDDTNPKIVGLETALDNLAKKGLSPTEMLKLFGKENITAAQHILTHREQISQLTEKVTGTQEAFSQAEKNNASLDHQLEIFWAHVSALGVALGTLLVPAINKVVEAGIGLTKFFTGSLTPASQAATEAFDAQKAKVLDLTRNIAPLLDRHDELKKKSLLTKTEQSELKTIISQVASVVPTAVTEFDKYGNALGVNTDKARDFIKIQKELLKYNNKDAIDKTQSELDQKTAQRDALQRKLNSKKTTEWVAIDKGGMNVERDMTAAEIKALDKQLKQFKDDIDGLEARKTGLNGDYLNTPAATSTKPVKPKTGEDGSGSGSSETKQEKAARLKREREEKAVQKHEDTLESLIEQARQRTAKVEGDEFEKEQLAFGEHYAKLFKLAQGNAQQTAVITGLMNTELAAIQAKEDKRLEVERNKREAERQKADLDELKDIGEQGERELVLKKKLGQLDIDTGEAAGKISPDKAKELSLQLEQTFLLAKKKLYDDNYEAMMNAAVGNTEAMTQLSREYAKTQDEIEQQQTDNAAQQAVARAKARKDLSLKNNESAAQEAEFQKMVAGQLYSVMSTNWDQTIQGYKDFWKQSSTVQKVALVAQKAWALAEIAINLSRQISADLTAAAIWESWVPGGGLLYGIEHIAKDTAMSALQTAAVLGVGVSTPAFADGGYTGLRDVHPGSMGPSGFVEFPTLFNMGKRSYVAGEKGREFVISNKALQNPVVANFTGMLDAAQKTGNYGVLSGASGGSTATGAGGSSSLALSAPAAGMSQDVGLAILTQLQKNNEHMEKYANRPILNNYRLFEQYQDQVQQIRNDNKL